jgi:hypothetical protein
MAVNPETLGNFSNPVVPKAPKAPRISMGDLSQASQDSADLYKAEGEAAVKKSMGEAQATRDAAYQTADIQRAAREPVLKELSTVSKGVDFKPSQETFIGMSSLAGLIAFIGTAAGQYGARSGKAAIDSMTGMMKGYQTGRQDVFRREQIQFEKEMASLKATQERLYKELDQADKTALIDSAKASADRAVAVAASGSDFLKASYNTKGARGVKDDLFKFMDAQQKADKMAQDLGIARDKMAQDREIAAAKASNQGILKPSAKISEGYVAQNILSNDLNGLVNDLKNPNLQKQISDYRIEAFLTEEGKVLNQLIAPNMPTELRQFLTKVRDIRNNYYLDISGKAVTGGEALRNYGTVPQPADTPEVILDKINSMKGRIDKKIQINQYLFKLPAIPSDLALAGTKTSLVPNQNYEQANEEEIINVTEGPNKGKYKKTSSGSYIRVD